MAARSAGRSRGIFKGFRRRLAPDAARSAKRASLYSSRSQLSLPIIAAKRPFVKKNRHFPGLTFRKTWRSSFLEAACRRAFRPKGWLSLRFAGGASSRGIAPGVRQIAALAARQSGALLPAMRQAPGGSAFQRFPRFSPRSLRPFGPPLHPFRMVVPPHHGLLGSGFRRRAHGAKKAAAPEIVEKSRG